MARLKLIVVLLFLSANLVAQNEAPSLDGKTFKEIKGTAKHALRLGDTYTALFYYEEWAKRKPENTKIVFQTAELYRITRNYVKAEMWYQKVVDNSSDKHPESIFYLAQMQMSLEKYEDAKPNFLKFKKVLRGLKDPLYRKLTKTGILGCDYALNLKDSNATAIIEHLDTSINQPHIEFSPIPLDENTLVYGSLKDNQVNYYNIALHDSMKIPLRKFYFAKKENDKWVAKGEYSGPFNKEGVHVGNGVLSEDGKRFYFTLCQKNWQNKVICHLYFSNSKNGKWQEAVKMNDQINIPNYTTTQPAIGRESRKNQEVIYFVSDRPGGKGGLDIWYTEYRKRRKMFKAPRNAGSRVNSAGTEFTPYYDLATHQLYYSSDGKIGIGGLDVFSIEGEKSRWQKPQNLKKEINSSADDIDFTLNKDHKGGFFVSNRKGGVALLNPTCCDDIYSFKLTEYININLLGKVLDSSDCLTDYQIYVYINDKETGERFLSKQSTANSCDFNINLEQGHDYTIEVRKDGYLNGSKDISTFRIKESKDLKTKINLSKIPKQPKVLEGILYEFNSSKLTPEAKSAIDESLFLILKQNPELIIQVASHTDNKGSDSYNQKLSQKRAQSVVHYLVLKGINEKRLQSQGYGESMPIAANQNPDGSDNPAGRKLNRRTDFQIIGKINPDDLIEDDIKKPTPKKKKNTF